VGQIVDRTIQENIAIVIDVKMDSTMTNSVPQAFNIESAVAAISQSTNPSPTSRDIVLLLLCEDEIDSNSQQLTCLMQAAITVLFVQQARVL
jgi:hypothetical protein